MENKKNCLEFSKDNSILLNNGISFVDNPKMINYLKDEKFKEENFLLKYVECTETNVSDLIKIKINIESIGFFLVNLKGNSNDDSKYSEIIERVKTLKSESNFELDNQYPKIKLVVDILNEYNLVYTSFVLEKDIPKEYIDFKDYKFNFPFLFINNVPKEKPIKSYNDKKILFKIEAPFFNTDYLFDLLFALFASFSLHTSVSLFSNDNWKGSLFMVLSLALICILNYCSYLIFYDKNAEKLKGQKLIMGLYLCFGTGIGLIISMLVCQSYLNVSYNGWLIFIDIFAFILCIGAIFSSKIITLFKKR